MLIHEMMRPQTRIVNVRLISWLNLERAHFLVTGKDPGTICLMYQRGLMCHVKKPLSLKLQDGLTESTLRRYQADAFIVVYSIADVSAAVAVQTELEKIHRGRQSPRSAVTILGNKLDLEHFRQVEADDFRPLAQKYQCRHVEISAAEDFSSVCSVFEGLLSDAFEAQKQRSKNVKRRRSILGNMSRKLGNMFKRKSLEDLLLKRRLSPSRQSARRSL